MIHRLSGAALALTLLCPLTIAGCPLPVSAIATRADLASAYLDLETALRDHPPPPDRVAAINRKFDEASISFFSGQFGRAIQQIDELRASVLAPEGYPDARRVLDSLKVRIDPPVFVLGRDERVVVEVASLYPVDLAGALREDLTIRLTPSAGPPITAATTLESEKTVSLETTVEVPIDRAALRPGSYVVSLASPGVEFTVGRWFVTETSFEAVRERNAARIRSLAAETAALKQAIGIAGARNDLLADEPSETNSAQFLADLPALSREVSAEIDAIAAGRNPYARRTGDHWRTTGEARGATRLRVFAPASVATDDSPRPLIVVFHGSGGDENMFFDGYGAGIVKTLSDARGAIVASPETTPFLRDPEAFPRLVDSLALDYPIDRTRVYAIGHSMGGAVVSQLAARPDLVAAVCGIASAGVPTRQDLAPTLLIAAENDLINRGNRSQTAASRAAGAGAPVEYRLVRDYGHTLVVGHVLPDVMDWLLSKRPASKTQPGDGPAGG